MMTTHRARGSSEVEFPMNKCFVGSFVSFRVRRNTANKTTHLETGSVVAASVSLDSNGAVQRDSTMSVLLNGTSDVYDIDVKSFFPRT